MRGSVFADEIARRRGLLQALDARVKLAGIVAAILAAMLSRRLDVIAALLAAAIVLAAASRVPAALLLRLWLAALCFTVAVGLPALVLTPGAAIAGLPLGLEATRPGARTLAYLVLRVETAATLSLLLVLTTRWASLLRGLRSLGVPTVFVVVLGMTYRYVFLLLRSAHDLVEARRSRHVGALPEAQRRRLATATAGMLFTRTLRLSDDVYLAMQARGFRGEVRMMEEPGLTGADWLALTAFLVVAAAAAWLGR